MGQPKKSRKTTKRAKSALTPNVATGPVTLEEARALATAKLATRPKGAKAVARKAVAPRATNATVGAEREKLRERQRLEVEARVEEYKATIAIMKTRGARKRRPKGKGMKAKGPAHEEAFVPLQIVAEGDSWFDYPVPLFGGGIIPRLEDAPWACRSSISRRPAMRTRTSSASRSESGSSPSSKKAAPRAGEWDVLLFSGGGNDIVGNPMALWVREWDQPSPGRGPPPAAVRAVLALVRAGYEDLIECATAEPQYPSRVPTYDFAIPTDAASATGTVAQARVRPARLPQPASGLRGGAGDVAAIRGHAAARSRSRIPQASPSSTGKARWPRRPARGTTSCIPRGRASSNLRSSSTRSSRPCFPSGWPEMSPPVNTKKLTILAQDPGVRIQGRLAVSRVDVPAERLDIESHRLSSARHRLRRRRECPLQGTGLCDRCERCRSRSVRSSRSEEQPPRLGRLREEAAGRSPLPCPERLRDRDAYARHFEFALGRRVPWGFRGHQINIAPHAFADANAFYSKRDSAALGYFHREDGATVFSWLRTTSSPTRRRTRSSTGCASATPTRPRRTRRVPRRLRRRRRPALGFSLRETSHGLPMAGTQERITRRGHGQERIPRSMVSAREAGRLAPARARKAVRPRSCARSGAMRCAAR